MKNIIYILILICNTFSTFAQVGGIGGGSGNNNGSGGYNSGFNTNINVNRNTPVLSGNDLGVGNYGNWGNRGPNTDNERYVFWLHGLNGDIGSWGRAKTASADNVTPNFQARKLKSYSNFTYSQSGDAAAAASDVYQHIDLVRAGQLTLNEDPKQNFLICHSQGGIVGRTILKVKMCDNNVSLQNLGFGGLVTVCTPNQGAKLLAGKEKFRKMAQDMCNSLIKGPALDQLDTSISLGFLGFKINPATALPVSYLVSKSCDILVGDSSALYNLVANQQTPKLSEDYEVGSDKLIALNNSCGENNIIDTFPKVAFYGVEPESGLMLRNAMYFFKSPNEYDYFEANDDSMYIKTFNRNLSKFIMIRDSHKLHLDYLHGEWNSACGTWWKRIINEQYCRHIIKDTKLYEEKIIAYQDGIDWYSRFDDQYKLIIGALSYDTSIVSYYKCICLQSDGVLYSESEVNSIQDCENDPNNNNGGITCYTQGPFTRYKFTTIKKESDGTVLAESAMNLPKATKPPVKLNNSSHMQARNSEQIRVALYDLYEGTNGGLFFKTAKK